MPHSHPQVVYTETVKKQGFLVAQAFEVTPHVAGAKVQSNSWGLTNGVFVKFSYSENRITTTTTTSSIIHYLPGLLLDEQQNNGS